MKNKIVAFLTENPDLNTFADLREHVKGFDGQVALVHTQFNNLVFWPMMSQAAVDAFVSLANDECIEFKRCHPGLYNVAGKSPLVMMPLAPQLQSYTSQHWYPVTISLC